MAACASRPNFANCDRAGPVASPVATSKVSTRVDALVEHTAVLRQLAHDDTRTEPPGPRRQRQTTEQRLDQGRLARSVRADERHPLRPADVEGERSQGELSALHDDVLEPGDHSSRATGLIDAEPQVPPLPGLLHDLSASRARSDRRARAANFSVRLMRKSRWALSLSRGWRRSRLTPVVAHWRSRWARERNCVRCAWFCA